MTNNDFCVQVTLDEGGKVSISNAQTKEVWKIIRKRIKAITKRYPICCAHCGKGQPALDLYEIPKSVKLT